jgi:electron transport complex protein RnfA
VEDKEMSFVSVISLALGAILIENFILVKFLGICPFLGVSKSQETAVGMGLAVTFVMGAASLVCWVIEALLLVPLGLEFARTVVYILVISSLVQFIEMFLRKAMPGLYLSLGIYLPLITTNCAVLGVALLNRQNGYNLLESVVYGVTGGLGFFVAIFIFAGVRERLELTADVPKAFEGFPIALVSAGLLSLAFMGFSGLKII